MDALLPIATENIEDGVLFHSKEKPALLTEEGMVRTARDRREKEFGTGCDIQRHTSRLSLGV